MSPILVGSQTDRTTVTTGPVESTSVDTHPPSAIGPEGPEGPEGPQGPVGPPAWGQVATWDPTAAYSATPPAALVSFGGSTYAAIADSIGAQPDTSPAAWHLIASGAGGALSLSHEQGFAIPSDTWVIQHGLGYVPNVLCVGTDGIEIKGVVIETGPARTVVSYAFPVPGTAYCS